MTNVVSHSPVLLREAVDAVVTDPSGVYVDGTFGRGGHSKEILARLNRTGRLIAIDRDPDAADAAKMQSDPRLTFVKTRMSDLDRVLDAMNLEQVDGMLFDLGVSSPQLGTPARGFSFQRDGPLDMRMDPTTGISVADWLSNVDEASLREVIRDYGEERFAKQIAAKIVAARCIKPIVSTAELASVVAKAVRTRERRQHAATRTFQALRIFINQELEEVALMLPVAAKRIRPGGRLVVISFHSLEDRIVKRFIQGHALAQVPRNLPLRAREMPRPSFRMRGRGVRPRQDEVENNPRARSALMRVAERCVDSPGDGIVVNHGVD